MTVVAVIAPGAMGAAVGRRLAEHGVEVRTLLAGRGEASRARARDAGMRDADEDGIANADIILSIVPPSQALPLAEQLAPALRRVAHAPVYADCNAVSPQTVRRVEAALAGTGIRFADAGIFGLPAKPGEAGPVFHVCGPGAAPLAALAAQGLRVRVLDKPVGAASGLKMSYAGITKGLTALGAAMVLAAGRFGIAAELRAELAESQGALLTRFGRAMPDMLPKAYRWVAEMEEIAAFAAEDEAAAGIYAGIARLYDRLAADHAGEGAEEAALRAFLDGKETR